MKIPVTQELIDAVKHTDAVDDKGHFPCLTERAIAAVLGYPVVVCGGYVSSEDDCVSSEDLGRMGKMDTAGLNYQYAYDGHRWDEIQPGEFEYTPGE